jgi:hypothetical protein
VLVDWIGKFEHLDSDVRCLKQVLGMLPNHGDGGDGSEEFVDDDDLPHLNRAPFAPYGDGSGDTKAQAAEAKRTAYMREYSPELRKLVELLYAEDL